MQIIFFGFVIPWLICLEISGDMSNNVTMYKVPDLCYLCQFCLNHFLTFGKRLNSGHTNG